MATLVLSAVGAQIGASIGGGVLGLSSAVIGRAVGATIGQYIDQRVLGQGGRVVEQGRVERFRLNGASEGAGIQQIYGRMRVTGQVIWASRFLERVTTEEVGGKGGGGGGTTVKNYSYYVSIAIALCEGEIARVGRVWADGDEISSADYDMRVYHGDDAQLPDPKIEAVEGIGNAPAYRGTAYVVFENLPLAAFGNRVPQFSFEVVRAAPGDGESLSDIVRATALVPGTGEYSLATQPIYRQAAPGRNEAVNVNSPLGTPDFTASIHAMKAELPHHKATSLIVSWFGTDLRCGECRIEPRVEHKGAEGRGMPWSVAGVTRGSAQEVPFLDGRPVYGGTPTDQSVVQAIQALRADGREVMFYPFVLMTQMEGNTLPNPYGGTGQPALPWRGRITTSVAPGEPGSPDGTGTTDAEVASFFGSSNPGAGEFSYRRFILHYAQLCAQAGGVDAFCIGSEMRGVTTLRGASGYPAVAALKQLAADVRAILPNTKIGYAADWTEYANHRPDDGSGDVAFHLDPLWADPNVDFVGIDNYCPLSDWRDGEDHADAHHRSIYAQEYLRGNVEGGERYDWYYASEADRDAQVRTPIEDTAHGEDWIFRVKDIFNWWSNPHHDRPGGVREAAPTDWVPQSKPIWFTEVGCPAVDKGANSPNLFYDPKSSESALPPYSSGRRDDAMQLAALRAVLGYWGEAANNPVSQVYGGPMVDLDHAFVWAWDARPFPWFPNARDTWTDGENYKRGHWLNGRASAWALSSVVRDLTSDTAPVDVSGLYGLVRGYKPEALGTGRAALQPLMLAHGFDAAERGGTLTFRMRNGAADMPVTGQDLCETPEVDGGIERVRASDAETVGRVRVMSVEEAGDYKVRADGATFPDETVDTVTDVDLPMILTPYEARSIAHRWLVEARAARDTAKLALPPSRRDVVAGTVVEMDEGGEAARFRVDRIEEAGLRLAEASRIEPAAYVPGPDEVEEPPVLPGFVTATPLTHTFLDLPLLTGDEIAHAPHIAVHANPWPGPAAVFKSLDGNGYSLSALAERPAVMGETLTDLAVSEPGLYDRGPALQVRLYGGALSSATEDALLNGANAAAIGDGVSDLWEVFQFREAELVAPGVYDLTMRLRGQAGTDAVMPAVWPTGSRFVLLTPALLQPDLSAAERGLARTWRVGPASKPVDDATYTEETRAFAGIGLRPYAPVHLTLRSDGADITVLWIRRTRIDGDSWAGLDVPLGETSESYLVRVMSGGSVIREAITASAAWTYTAAEQSADGVSAPFAIDVSQVSDRFGPGPFRRIEIDA